MRLESRLRRLATASPLLAMPCAVLALAAAGAAEAPGPGNLLAVRAGRIVPVDGPETAPGILLVRGGKVEAVVAASHPIPDGAETVDLGDAVVIPGLVNPMTGIVFGPSFLDGRRGAVSSPVPGPG